MTELATTIDQNYGLVTDMKFTYQI